MRTLWRGILSFFFAAAAFAFSQEEKTQINLSIDIWDDDEERDAFFISREESLEKQIREKLSIRGLDDNGSESPAYLGIDIHKKQTEIFIDIAGSKKVNDSEVPFFAKELHYFIETEDDEEEDEDEEEDGEEWWSVWVTIEDKVLEQVEIFLNHMGSP